MTKKTSRPTRMIEHLLANGIDVGTPATNTIGVQAFVIAGRKSFGCYSVAMDAIEKFDIDARHSGSENQAVTMVGPLGQINSKDLLELCDTVSRIRRE